MIERRAQACEKKKTVENPSIVPMKQGKKTSKIAFVRRAQAAAAWWLPISLPHGRAAGKQGMILGR